jgi:hypothetical protein
VVNTENLQEEGNEQNIRALFCAILPGDPAVIVPKLLRPVTLRPGLSAKLPFADFVASLNIINFLDELYITNAR